MKILMITPYLPYPLHSGGQVRSYNLIKNIAKKHEIYLVALAKSSREAAYVPHLEKICQKVWVFPRASGPWKLSTILRTGFSRRPFLVVRNFSSEAKGGIVRIMRDYRFDLIHAETFYVMPHLPDVQIPVLLVEQTIECQVYAHFVDTLPGVLSFLKPLLWLDVMKLRWWEKFYWRKADLVVAVSPADREKIRTLVPGLRVEVVPNGVDVRHFSRRLVRRSARPTVLFVGNFKWLQNKEAARLLIEEIWPRLAGRVKDIRLRIVGQHSREFVGSRSDVESGEVEDIRTAYQGAHVFIAPFKSGGGSRLKIFEAMASGLPVVSTAKGVEGIGVKPNVHYFRGETPSELARQIEKVLLDSEWSRHVGRQGKKYIQEHFDWRVSTARLVHVYEECKKT